MDDANTQMTCVLKLNIQRSGWDRSLYKLLKGIGDVSYTVDATKGLAYVSGKISPEVILKIRKAKKHTQLIHMEYGYKNPNYPPENPPADASMCPYCSPDKIPINSVQNPYESQQPPPQGYYYQYSPYSHQARPQYSYPYSTSPYYHPYSAGEQQCRIL